MTDVQRTRTKTKISLKIHLSSEEEALNVVKAMKVDDDNFVNTIVEGYTVIGEVEADSVEGARRAADDWLACLMAIVKEN